MDHPAVAKRVLAAVGGPEKRSTPPRTVRAPATVLVDQEAVDQKALDNDPDVKGTFLAGGMYQIIIGPGDVDIVYDSMIQDGGVTEVSKDEAKQVAAQKDSPLVS